MSDLKLIVLLFVFATLWTVFMGLMGASPALDALPGADDGSIIDFSIMDVLSNAFSSDNILINTFVFGIVAIMIIALTLRFLRGQG